MAYQSEAALEQQFIDQLNKQGYTSVSIPDYDALVENFKTQFETFNSSKLDRPLTDKEWERVMNIMLGKSVFQSAKILRDKFVLEREDGTKVYLSFFDADHTKNIFQVTNQTTVVGKYVNRYDVTILVNGLPLIQVELKRRGIDIREAVNQVMRYKKHSYNGLYHFIQLFVVSNGVDTKYFANSDRDMLHSLAFFWTDFNNVRITNLKEFSISFLARDHIIKMLTRYTILNDTDKLLMVMRPYQVYAVEALVRQATLTNRNAYVWHTTGAGKTLTSFKTAQILAANPNIKKVIFLVDRKDLDSQTTEEFNKFENGSVDATDRTDVLVKQMQNKNRQLIVTTMQKMANAVKRPQYSKIMDTYKNEKVVFIIDECHRSQFGDMHKDIVRHFQKAQFFGFTGTPRFEVNGKTEGKITQTTEMLFGECVHNYLIKDARPLQQATFGMAAVVDAFLMSGALQMAVCHIRPCGPPQDKLLVAVPSFRDGILPSIFGTFGVFGYPFIALGLCCGRSHIHLLFAHLVRVLFFPAVGLRLLELGSGKAPFLAVFDTEIFFLGLVLPFSLFIQRAHRQQDMGMGIVSGRIVIYDYAFVKKPKVEFRSKLKSVLIVQYLKILYNRN